MTLIQQFPDVSNLIREKKKMESKNKAVLLKGLHYNPKSQDQKFYDKEFRVWHYKLLLAIGLIFTALYFLILNGRAILESLAS